MNHSQQYANLINKAIARTPTAGAFYERHHIMPRSLGGKDDAGNIVLLTVREHYLAHLLLAHIPGFENQWMSVAAIMRDSVNPRRAGRFFTTSNLRWKRWVRKRIAFHQALVQRSKMLRQAQEANLRRIHLCVQRYERQIEEINASYADRMLGVACEEVGYF